MACPVRGVVSCEALCCSWEYVAAGTEMVLFS